MPNTSATGGYLVTTTTAPAYDGDLDRLIQQMVVGITGLAGTMVRPRWQPTPPKQPEPSVDWCAIGVQSVTPDDGPAIVHDGTGNGTDTVNRHEDIEFAASFYGPHGLANATLLRDGFSLPQNTEAIGAAGLLYVGTSMITPAPALVNEQWVRKYDLRFTLRRHVSRTFPVLNLLSAVGTIHGETVPDQPFEVES